MEDSERDVAVSNNQKVAFPVRGCQDKQSLCELISTLQSQVNEMAVALSIADGPELHKVWLNLANARAYLTTALEVARELKTNQVFYH